MAIAEPNDRTTFTETYFEDVEARLNRLDLIVDQGLFEEAFILTCCYLNGLARDRLASTEIRDDMELFTNLIRQYGSHSEIFEKVSRIEITRRSVKDPFAPKALPQHTVVTTAILARFGNDVSVADDPTEDELLNVLSGIPQLNIQNLRANLWRYTYGAVLYRRWRSTGTHAERLGTHMHVETNQEVYPSQADGPAVYYDSCDRLIYSSVFIMNTFRHTVVSLRDEYRQNEYIPSST